MKKRPIYKEIIQRIKEPRKFIQVLLGPRQVGKTTIANQLEEQLKVPVHFVSADTATLEDLTWIQMQWEVAREKQGKEVIFILDEVQKILHWSDIVKKMWDEDSRKKRNVKVILLGSSPWLMYKGLTESLTGRFEIIPITHWNYPEMHTNFHFDLNHFLYFGGYPGPVSFSNEKDLSRWLNYINDSIIETTISRDILLMSQVNKPILLRRLFQLGAIYSSQILSYHKMQGQLQDAGNTTTLAHYVELLTGAGLIAGIEKYANHTIRRRSSSPKLLVYNTALMSAQSKLTFQEAKEDKEFWGRLVESAVGAHLLNGIRGTQMELYYWREKDKEVDFVLKKGKSLIAIEVKSSIKKEKLSGISLFNQMFHPKRLLVVGRDGIPLEKFLSTPIRKWFL